MSQITPPGPPMEEPGPPHEPAGHLPPPPGTAYARDPFAAPPSYGRFPAAQVNPPPPSRKMAGWALGLSLAFCIPFGFLVAIGLAIAVLVKSRDGRDHGKGMAIAALVISGLLLLGNIAYVVIGVGQVLTGNYDETTRDDGGSVVGSGDISVTRLRVGDCFNQSDDEAPPEDDVSQAVSLLVSAVPCRESHAFEVYSVVRVPGSDYPGDDAIQRLRQQCLKDFEAYVGVPPLQSSLSVLDYFPTARSWRFGHRTVTCSLAVKGYRKVGHSLRGSKR